MCPRGRSCSGCDLLMMHQWIFGHLFLSPSLLWGEDAGLPHTFSLGVCAAGRLWWLGSTYSYGSYCCSTGGIQGLNPLVFSFMLMTASFSRSQWKQDIMTSSKPLWLLLPGKQPTDKDPTKPGRNCQEKQKRLLAVTSPPERETSAMSSITEQLVSPTPCHYTDQVLGCQTPFVCCFAGVECKSRRNKHRVMSTSVLVLPSHFSFATER